jgi:hypothetical protein
VLHFELQFAKVFDVENVEKSNICNTDHLGNKHLISPH